MKKLLLLITFTALFSFNTEKKLTVELSIADWQKVMHVIDESNAPHSSVKDVQRMIVSQLQKQITDSTQKR